MKRVAAVVFVAVLITAAVQADVIYNNFGPGDTYYLGSMWPVSGPTSVGYGVLQSVAMPFTPSGSYTFDTATVAMGYIGGTNSFDLALYDDASGLPGTALESWTGIAAGPFDSPGATETVVSVTNPLLASGSQYWLVASPGAGDTLDAWMFTPGLTYYGPLAFAQGGPWISFTYYLSTFRVTGSPAQVPEPCTCALFGLGALGLLGRRRKK